MQLKKVIALITILAGTWNAAAEEVLELTLADAIARAQQHSPDAQSARHTYLAAYWNYRFYRANYLPSLTLSAAPELNHQINRITQSDGTERFLNQNQLNSDLTLTVNQNVWFTGGSFFATSSVRRMDVLDDHTYSYNTNPITIGYRQSLFGYNSLKWDRRIEPLAYREACKAYAESLELVAAQTCNLFFILASAQADRDIASANYASADTLFRYAEGRYRIGTITKNEMLQLEINKLNEEANLLDAQTAVEDAMQDLRSFLGLTRPVALRVVTEHHIPRVEVPVDRALQLAYEHSPEPDAHQRQLVEGKSNLARAKANAGLKADLYLQFGLSQTGDRLEEAYRRPLNQQYVSLSLSLPILDWGRGKGQIRVARSQLALTETQVAQQRQDFEQNVVRMVRQFNLQDRRVAIAWRTDSTAQQRNEVARRLYLQGKSTVLDWNASVSEKDAARRSYIQALQQFWALYYGLRSLTQYDFARRQPLAHLLPEP